MPFTIPDLPEHVPAHEVTSYALRSLHEYVTQHGMPDEINISQSNIRKLSHACDVMGLTVKMALYNRRIIGIPDDKPDLHVELMILKTKMETLEKLQHAYHESVKKIMDLHTHELHTHVH